jgi:hypothetical protein
MRIRSTVIPWALALLAVICGTDAQADKRTVCTITVNSPNEKEVLRQRLPEDQFDFVELVEHGRPEWLASACQQGVRCDMLVISGHSDGGTQFYSDRPDVREFLPVGEMERISCSDSCPGLFSQLKEVYLFGCNTLDPAPVRSSFPEVARSLVDEGHSPAEAERLARVLDSRHGESSRDRMRRIFFNVPVIYGFSSAAPLGAKAGPLLDRFLQSAAPSEIGSGRANAKLLGQFAASSMTAASGLRDSDPDADYRRDVCQFIDERLSPAEKLRFIHDILGRDMVEVRLFLDRIEGVLASFSEGERQAPSFTQALAEIARDGVARERYLHFAEDVGQPAIRGRMIALAGSLGWLAPAEQRNETLRMIGQVLARPSSGVTDVDLICSMNRDHKLDGELDRFQLSPAQAGKVAPAAGLACLGSAGGRARVLAALSSPDEEEVQIAQVYLGHRPITDVTELRSLAREIARMPGSAAQVRALDTLARHYVSDRETLDALAALYPAARSVEVQRAIAALIIRSDYRAMAEPEFIRVLSQRRLKSTDGKDVIDLLIRRLQTP